MFAYYVHFLQTIREPLSPRTRKITGEKVYSLNRLDVAKVVLLQEIIFLSDLLHIKDFFSQRVRMCFPTF